MSEREGCIAFEEDLSAWIDGQIVAVRRVELERHVESCAACRARAAGLRAVDAELLRMAAAHEAVDAARLAAVRRNVDARLDDAPLDRPLASRAPRRPRRWLAPAVAASLGAAAAATLLLLVRPAPPTEPLADRGRDRAFALREPIAPPAAAPPPEARVAAEKRAEAFARSGASAVPDAEVEASPPRPTTAGELEVDSARDLEMIERMAALSEAERSKLERNLERWQELSPEERDALRTRLQRGVATH
jgi:Putative zinc-finger/Protein of unknown function (DUF3106)